MFIDTHAHLTDKQFQDDIDDIIIKSQEYGLDYIITSGFNIDSSLKAIDFAKKYKNIYVSVGIYPEYADEATEKNLMLLKSIAEDEKVVAIGEIGLQFTEGMPSEEVQKRAFIKQLQLAYEAQKPIIIHCREAMGKLIQVLEENKHLIINGGTLHCFSGSYESAERFMNLGLNISVGGVSTFKNAQNLKNVLSKIPLERLMLETDCPYLTPHPYRGKRNAPFFIPTIAENLADIKKVSIREIADQTTKNALKLFKIGGEHA